MARVGVVLSAYNAGPYLKQAVDSVLSQSFRDIALYVVDDGSTDGSIETLSPLRDSRLAVVSNGRNRGLVYSLNRGLELAADCEFIARMDADDICLPGRFLRQVEFLDANSKVGVLGGASRYFGHGHIERNWFNPADHESILGALAAKNPISHPTVMIRAATLGELRYDESFPKYEDYALWIEMIGRCRFANLGDVILKYRRHGANVTSTYASDPARDVLIFSRLARRYAEKVGTVFSYEEIEVLAAVTSKVRASAIGQISLRRARDVVDGIVLKVAHQDKSRRFVGDLLNGCLLKYAVWTSQIRSAFCLPILKSVPRALSVASVQVRGK